MIFGNNEVDKRIRLFRQTRELFFYGDIEREEFNRIMSMARSKDIEMNNLVDIIIQDLIQKAEKREWNYPKEEELDRVETGTLFHKRQ